MKNKHIVATVIGTSIEYYDYMLYMHFLIILAPLYLPNNNPEVNALLGFSTFAIGYFTRPLGGVIFGHIGDKLGRRKAVFVTIIFSTLATFCMGLLPTYAQIGFVASILLILLRCMQSLSVGGEVPSASCFLIENSTVKNRCLRSSYISVATSLAGIVAAFLGFLCTTPFMPEWGWRIPFLMVILFGTVGFYLRRNMAETPEFKRIYNANKTVKVPIVEVIKKDKLPILVTLGICAGVMAPFSVLYGYLPLVIKDKLGIPVSTILLVNSGVMACEVVFAIFMGLLGDKIGAKKLMLTSGVIFLCLVYPLFNIFNNAQNLFTIVVVELAIVFIIAGIISPLNVVTSLMYPTQRRITGKAFAWGLCSIVFAGLSPLISKSLVSITNNPNSPALWLLFCTVLMLVGVKYAPTLKSISSSEYIPRPEGKGFFNWLKPVEAT